MIHLESLLSERNPARPNLDEKLSVDNLSDVLDRSTDAHTKWYEVGVALRIPVGTLDGFDKPPMINFIKVTDTWLRTDPNPTWRALAYALSNKLVGRPDLGKKIIVNGS